MKKWIWFCSLLLGTCFLFADLRVSASVPERPIGTTVLDETGILSQETIDTIDQENRSWEETDQQLQIGVYITDHLTESLESQANATFRKWQVGFSGTNNGVLLFMALEDRKFRLETSDNAATILTDVEAKSILEAARTFFREEDYDGGIGFIVDAIGDEFYGTDRAQTRLQEFEEENDDIAGTILFFIIMGVAIVIYFIGKGGGRGGGSGSDLLWWLLLSSSNSSHSSYDSDHDSWSGGGDWSGGGGGGGGASSGW
ncbi:TPM domain-containing protein [Streptococcus sp. 20-1249]|uniref:TPM domain-containing protein n=1 Tax=Streptococcus hepaticus TaxID=3349163 RepID=UPI00374A07F9